MTRGGGTAALGGAVVAAAFWLRDAWSLQQLQFAGVSDPDVQSRLLAATARGVVLLELKLVLLHVALGAALGLLLALGWPGRRPLTHPRALALGAFGVTFVQILGLFGMMGRYPQLYADRWWLGGGIPAEVQRLATHVIGPRVFDALLILLVAVVAAGLVVRHVVPAFASARPRPVRAALAALGLAVLVLAVPSRPDARPEPASAGAKPRPNVLILVADSLRTDRLESSTVMPFTSSLVREGTLFRHAFTPIARTFPSWVSILTGQEPRHTGVRTMFPRVEDRRALGPTFVSELRDQGYRTFVVSDFAGDIFPRFPGGFQVVDTPNLTAEALARATVFAAHGFSLPLLRLGPLRGVLDEWRNLASLSDPEWLVDRALAQLRAARGRPFAGVVFFSTSHFPYVAPWPDYLWRAGDYRGPYLYHAPPVLGDRAETKEDVEQVRARYDGSLRAVDRATRRLLEALHADGRLDRTVVVVSGDHGEELYEEPGIAGHGDVIGGERSQVVPILLRGPGISPGRVSNAQVRLIDLGATFLGLVDPARETFGDGVSLFAPAQDRPLCVETGIWFWPTLPAGLRGRRLVYPGIAELLELDPGTREMVLRRDLQVTVESAKRRGLVLGARLWVEQLTPDGHEAGEGTLPGVDPQGVGTDLKRVFDERCVAGDPRLQRFLGAVVYRPEP